MPYSKTTELKGALLEVVKQDVRLIYNNHVVELPMLSAAKTDTARQNENANLHSIEALAMDVSHTGIDRKTYESLVSEVYCWLGQADRSCVVCDSEMVPAGIYPLIELREGLARVKFKEGHEDVIAIVPSESVMVVPKLNIIPIVVSGVIESYVNDQLEMASEHGTHSGDCGHH